MTDQLDTKAIRARISRWILPPNVDTDFLALCDALDKMKADNDRLRSALGRIRPIPERILQRIPVRDLAETLAEVDAALAAKKAGANAS